MKFLALAALEVVILTTSSAASDENFFKIMTFPFQCIKRNMTTEEEHTWHSQNNTPYPTLTGELWGVYCVYPRENLLHNDVTQL